MGAHKFYEGLYHKGILYACTGGILGIGWVIDTIKLLFENNPYFVSSYRGGKPYSKMMKKDRELREKAIREKDYHYDSQLGAVYGPNKCK